MTHINTSSNYDLEALLPGAGAAVHTCMAVQADDRVLIFYGTSTERIGRALAHVASQNNATTVALCLDNFASRPLTQMPLALQQRIVEFAPTVTFYAASSEPGELAFRHTLTILLYHTTNPRHAHMPGITEAIMQEGMAVDYQQVHDLTLHVADILRQARRIHVTNPKGTDVVAEFAPQYKWIPSHSFYHNPGDWGNLPEGEVYTCPATVEGTVVADVLGDYFSEAYGLLDDPVSFVIANSRGVDIQCANQQLLKELTAYLDSDPNSRRVGEFAIGTNIGLRRLIGNLLQDEKYPGMHIAFGNPYGLVTGADWVATTHIDVIPSRCTIDVDGRRLMTDGVFAADVLTGVTSPHDH